MKEKQKPKLEAVAGIDWGNAYEYFLVLVLGAAMAMSAVMPDSKIARYKLEALEIGAFALFFLWAAGFAFFGKIEIRKNFLNVPVLIYLAGFLIFYFIVPNKLIAQQELRRLLLCCGLFFPAANVLSNGLKRNVALFAWTGSALLVALYGVLQYFGGFSTGAFFTVWYIVWGTVFFWALKFSIRKYKWIYAIFGAVSIGLHLYASDASITQVDVPRMERVMSTFGNPIFFAAYLVLALPVLFSLLLIFKGRLTKLFAVSGILIIGAAVFFAKTRASWIGLAVAMCLWVVLIDYNRNWRFFGYLCNKKIAVLICAGLVFYGHFIFYPFCGPYKNNFDAGIKYFVEIAKRQQAHPVIWRDSLRIWQDHPVFGVGLGGFHTEFPPYASDKLKSIWPQGKFIVNDAHNEYIQILVETGVAGFLIIMFVFFAFFFQIKLLWKKDAPANNDLLAGFAAGAAALLIQNFFSVDMRFIISSAYLFIVMGMTAGFGGQSWEYDIRKDFLLRLILLAAVCCSGVFMYKAMVKPYKAYQELRSEVDFFDEKVLQPAKSIGDLKKLLVEYPGQAKIYEKLGYIYSKEKQWNEAIASYNKAVGLDPKLAGAYNNLGNIHFMLNKLDKAIEYYKKAISINDGLLDSHLNLGKAYYHKGRLKESAYELEKVLKLDPDNYKAISMLKKMTE